ncbi:MAG: NAD(P)/FAD-dependent oxidoreductase, partial [Phycisphaeraceae bacterium]
AALARLDLGALPARLGAAPLEAMRLAVHGHEARFALPGGVSLSRCALDQALAAAAQEQGATFRDATHATLVASGNGRHRLALEHGEERYEIQARTLAVADGVGGRLLAGHPAFRARVRRGSRLGLGAVFAQGPAAYERGAIHMACTRAGYVGLVQLEGGELDVAAALDPRFVKRAGGPMAAVQLGLREVGWPALADEDAVRWQGTALLTRCRRPVAHEGIILLGDAAGYVEPFTGEGIGWALLCGEAAGDLLARAGRGWHPALARAWARRYRRIVARRQARCRVIAALLRRPGVVRVGVGLAARWPAMARPVVEAVSAA